MRSEEDGRPAPSSLHGPSTQAGGLLISDLRLPTSEMHFHTGYIEGYYGRLLTWDERALIVNRLAGLGLTTYVYAPKEDPRHRQSWRAAYPPAWRADFRRLASDARRKRVTLTPALSPGLSFDYLSNGDYRALLAKCRAFLDDGAVSLALLMDDIPERLPRNCKGRFRSLGEAHGRLAARLLDDLTTGGRCAGLWFCPTVYCDRMAGEGVASCAYLTDLAATLPREVIVLWTGTQVISPELNAKSLAPVLRLFPGRMVIWDNLYANDYCPRRIFLGPYQGRAQDLRACAAGVLLNPTGLVNTDALLLGLLAGFARGQSPQESWRDAVDRLDAAKEVRAVAPFFAVPGSPSPRFGRASIAAARRALKRLVWDWKSPLQREWYPYLYSLDCDLQVVQGSRDETWIERKYPPALWAAMRIGEKK